MRKEKENVNKKTKIYSRHKNDINKSSVIRQDSTNFFCEASEKRK